ncbi:hypothetical protein TNCV_4933021 [Trichonephila clavipes]|nr:hypothetical protein TNCV_4933021 [Trichonephila clavipes]
MAKDISSLTLKDLRRIYHFLNPRSRLTASLVCKQWLQAIDCPELLCDVRVKFSGEINAALVVFSRMTRRFQWFSFYRVDIGNPVVEFLLKLEKLTLDGSVICKEELYKRFYATEEFAETNPSHEVLSFLSIKRLMEQNRNTLKHINFKNLSLSAEDILTISKIDGLNLRSVSFPFNSNPSNIKEFCVNQFYLTSLDLSTLEAVTNDTVCDICKCLPNLQELIIRCNGTIDWCMTEIFQMQNLTKLDLRSCSKISHVSYVMAVSILKAFKLKHLNLAFTKISDRSLFELLERNPKICYLNASGIDISNKTLNMICRNLTLLESLMLESCPTISDSGLTGEFENYSDSITPTPLSNLKYLRELNLGKNNRITNRGCVKAIRFPELKILFLNEWVLGGCGSPMVKVSNLGRYVMSSSPVPLKTSRVGRRCTINLSRAETSFRWYGS